MIPTPEQVRTLRTSLGLTQRQAADRFMVSLRTIQGWETPEGMVNHRECHPLMWAGIHSLIGVDNLKTA